MSAKHLRARGDITKKIIAFIVVCTLLCGCARENPAKEEKNQNPFIGVWISCYELDKMLSGGNFKKEFTDAAENLKEFGVNNAFLHVCAFSDSLFASKYYKQKENTLGYDFDVLKFMTDTLGAAGIGTHAWINPFRAAPGVFKNPADPGVRATVLCGIREIIDNYDVAGIHFDDYFYPADSDSLDNAEYTEYKKTAKNPLGKDDWRRANVSALVFAVKDLVDSYNKNITFSISPAADIEKNENAYFADVKAWCKDNAADFIIPQLYFGFRYPDGKFCFSNLLNSWKELTKDSKTKLIIGLAAYKVGTENPPDNAEWQKGEDILSRQTELCLFDEKIFGVCFFSYTYLFSGNKLNTAARERVKEVISAQ